MLAEFKDQSDKNGVVANRPWNFDKSLILVKEFKGQQQVKSSIMNQTSFWVRVFDLPLMARNEYTNNLVGMVLGKVEEVDIEHEAIEWGEYMRIRVCLNITKPLLRGKRMNLGLTKSIWVRFTYERL